MLFIAPKGRGKTWWLINLGKRAANKGKKVLHITMENSKNETQMRYFQAMFSIPKSEAAEGLNITNIRRDMDGELAGFEWGDRVEPEFTFRSPTLALELRSRVRLFGDRMHDVIIKQFPPRTMTWQNLEAYLDTLEQVSAFIPDLIIVDYVGIMKLTGSVDARRHSLDDQMLGLRAIAVKRNIALVTAHQGNRGSAEATTVRETHIAEAWGITHTADIVMTYSATREERKRKLARLYVTNARQEQDNFGALLTQNYATGQFVLDSTALTPDYFNILEEFEHGSEATGGEGNSGEESRGGED